MEKVAKWIGGNDFFGDVYLSAVNYHGPDVEIGSVMRHARVRKQLHCGCSTSNHGGIPDQRPGLIEKTPKSFGHQSNRTEYVAVYLVGLVKHKPSYIPIAAIASVAKIETVDRFYHYRARPSHFERRFISS